MIKTYPYLSRSMVSETLLNAKRQLKNAGVVSYECDAEILLRYVLGVERIDLYTGGADINENQIRDFEELTARRAKGEPLQYITGKAEFFGLSFYVKPGIFIPRPETEVLVDAVINMTGAPEHQDISLKLLDLCTGSGCIAICLAKYANCGKIIATDISEKVLETAVKNAVLNGVDKKIYFKKADLFQGLNGKFDIITCNPPYIKREGLKRLPREVSYDPLIALDGGGDGLDFYRKVAQQAPEFLKDKAALVLELGDGQGKDVKNMFPGETEIIKDLNDIDRILIWTK